MNKQEFEELEKLFENNGIYMVKNSPYSGKIIKWYKLPEPKRFRVLYNNHSESNFIASQVELIKKYGGRFSKDFSVWYLTTD